MEFAGIIFIITLILQSYILADKNHIENIKIYRYVINMIVLLLVVKLVMVKIIIQLV